MSAEEGASKPFTLKVRADGVSIIFHATGVPGTRLNDLTPNDIDLFDDGNGPGDVVSVERLKNSQYPYRICLRNKRIFFNLNKPE